MPTIIELDDESTWPREVRRTLEGSFELLRAFREEESADALRGTYEHRPNPHAHRNGQVLCSLEKMLADCQFAAYHCTRLLPEEIESIRASGLKPCSPMLTREKFRILHERGLIDDSDLAKSEGLDLSARSGLIYALLHRDSVDDGCNNFFTFWGGEAVHASELFNRNVLRDLGKPCIVECVASRHELDAAIVGPLASVLVETFLLARGIGDPSDLPEASFNVPLRVRDIFVLGDERFSSMVDWRPGLEYD